MFPRKAASLYSDDFSSFLRAGTHENRPGVEEARLLQIVLPRTQVCELGRRDGVRVDLQRLAPENLVADDAHLQVEFRFVRWAEIARY